MKCIICLLIFIFLFASIAEAQDPFHKLSRGIANLVTGWIELPKNIYEVTIEKNIWFGLTQGLFAGLGMSIVRMSSGLWDIITFPFPLPDNYAPILYPEFVGV